MNEFGVGDSDIGLVCAAMCLQVIMLIMEKDEVRAEGVGE